MPIEAGYICPHCGYKYIRLSEAKHYCKLCEKQIAKKNHWKFWLDREERDEEICPICKKAPSGWMDDKFYWLAICSNCGRIAKSDYHGKTLASTVTPQTNTNLGHASLSTHEIEYLTQKAESCIDSQNLPDALKYYNQLVEGASPHPHFYKRRALINRMVGQFDAAISDMNIAIELNPDDSASYWERGACYAHKLSQITSIGKDEKKSLLNKILQDYKGSVQRNPSSSEGWLAILETDMLLHNWDDAISNYGACKPYIDSREYHLVRSWLGCVSLIFAGDPLEEEDKKPLDDNSIRLKRTQWCVSEIDSLLIELENAGFDKDKLNRAKVIHQIFIDHFSEPPMRFDG